MTIEASLSRIADALEILAGNVNVVHDKAAEKEPAAKKKAAPKAEEPATENESVSYEQVANAITELSKKKGVAKCKEILANNGVGRLPEIAKDSERLQTVYEEVAAALEE